MGTRPGSSAGAAQPAGQPARQQSSAAGTAGRQHRRTDRKVGSFMYCTAQRAGRSQGSMNHDVWVAWGAMIRRRVCPKRIPAHARWPCSGRPCALRRRGCALLRLAAPPRTAGADWLRQMTEAGPGAPSAAPHLHHCTHAACPDLIKHRLQLGVLAAATSGGGRGRWVGGAQAGWASGQHGGCRKGAAGAACA